MEEIIDEKSAQPDEAGGALPYPFTLSTIKGTFVVYAPAECSTTIFTVCPLPPRIEESIPISGLLKRFKIRALSFLFI
jgi:hypothetical protein